MRPGQDQTRDPRICSQTRCQLGYAALYDGTCETILYVLGTGEQASLFIGNRYMSLGVVCVWRVGSLLEINKTAYQKRSASFAFLWPVCTSPV